MKYRWLFGLIAFLLVFPMVSSAGGQDAILLENEAKEEVSSAPEPSPTETTEPEPTPEPAMPAETDSPPAKVERIELTCDYCTVPIGKVFGVDAWIHPDVSPYRKVQYKWSSSNTSVVTIIEHLDHSILVKSVGAGKATITVKADNISVSITITVIGDETPTSMPSAAPRPTASGDSAVILSPNPTGDEENSGTFMTPQASYSDTFMTPQASPSVTPKTSGWEAAEHVAAKMKPGGLARITAPGNTLVPVSLLKKLREMRCALEISLDGYACIIDGCDLAALPDDLQYIDIGMSMKKDAAVSTACGGNAYELRFSHQGKLPGLFTFRVKAENCRPGDTVYVYYFNEETGKFEDVQSAVVDDNGYVSFSITHCSSYYLTDTIIAGAENNFELPTETTAANSKNNSHADFSAGKVFIWIGIFIVANIVIALLAVALVKRKRHTEHIR